MIHHYTTIGALASILRYRTIRFSRLNTLDDTEEAQQVGRYDFGSKLFASCWVEKEEEDIAQWAMYGHAMRGVRLSLPRQPFALVPAFGLGNSLPQNLRFDGYCLLPDSDASEDFVRSVNYVDDVQAEYHKRVQLLEDGGCRIQGRHTDLATFKHRRWSFQQEVRFILHAMVGPSDFENQQQWTKKFIEIAGTEEWQHGGPATSHIDLPLSADALIDAKVVLGPLTDESDRLIVESLVASHDAGYLRVQKSDLAGLIRHR